MSGFWMVFGFNLFGLLIKIIRAVRRHGVDVD